MSAARTPQFRSRGATSTLVVLAILFTSMNTMADTPATDTPATDTSPAAKTPKEQAEEQKAIAEAQKAAFEAQKAASEAKLAALTARLGGVPDSPIKGEVTVETKGGELEMALLATKAINRATVDIGEELKDYTKNATLYVYPASQPPNLQAVAGLLAQKVLVERALTQAAAEADKLMNPKKALTESVAAVGIAIESITKLLGFFRSDFKVGGADITFEDSVLVQAAARVVPAKKLLVPTLYNAVAITGAQTLVTDELATLVAQQQKAADVGIKLDAAIAEREQIAGKAETTATEKADIEKSLPPLRTASERIKTARTAYDTLLSRLLGSDEATAALLRDLATWKGLRRKDSQLLLLKVQRSGGSYYVEKNLWTTFGVMPFSVAGGAVVSYTLLQADDGSVLASGVHPIHGGFQKVKEVPASLTASALPMAVKRTLPTEMAAAAPAMPAAAPLVSATPLATGAAP